MAKYQFKVVIEGGFIYMPDEYMSLLESSVRVVVMPENRKMADKASIFPHLHLDKQGYKFDRDEVNAR